MGKKLQMSLKKQWFEMTKAGIKTEDYREINEYWFKRLVFKHENVFKYCTGVNIKPLDSALVNMYISRICSQKSNFIAFNPFELNRMTLGYPKGDDEERIIEFEHAGIEIREGNPEWGAEKGKMYFVIKHGKRIKEYGK